MPAAFPAEGATYPFRGGPTLEIQTLERPLPALSLAPATTRAPRALSLAPLLPGLLFAYFLLSPQPAFARDPFAETLRHHIVIGSTLLLWLGGLVWQRRLPRPTSLELPLVLLLVATAAAAATAPDRRLALEPALNLLSVVLLFYILVDLPGIDAATLRRGLMFMALAAALVVLISVWSQWRDWLQLRSALVEAAAASPLPPTVPRVQGVGSHPNILGAVLSLTAPLFVLSALHCRGIARLAVLLMLFVVELAVFFTLARSAWAGQAAALLLWLGWLSLVAWRRGHLRRRPLAAAGAGAVLLLLIAVAVLVSGARPNWLFRASLAPRADLRAVGWRIFLAHPWLGAGPGSFPLLYPRDHGGYPEAAIHSHNVLIQVAADTGLAGLLAAGGLAGAVSWRLRQLWREGDDQQRALAAAVAASLICFAVNGMGDSLHLFPEVDLVLAALVAMVLRAMRERTCTAGPAGFWPRRWQYSRLAPSALAGTLLLLIVPLAFLWLRIDEAAAYYAQSLDLAAAGRWRDSARAAGQASTLDPTLALYHVQAGVALAQAGDPAGGEGRATAELERALALEPRSAPTGLDLAALLVADQPDQARKLLPELVRDANRDSLILLAEASLEERLQPEQAVDVYAGLLVLNPTLADTPFWQGSAFRRDQYARIVGRAIERVDEVAQGSAAAALREAIQIYAGTFGNATPAAATGGGVSALTRGRFLLAAGEYAAAAPLLRSAAARQPDDPVARLALGDLKEATGDPRGARAEWLAAAYLGDAASLDRLGNSYPPGQVPAQLRDRLARALLNLSLARYYLSFQHYRFAYQRREPLPIVPRGDWLNALPNSYYAWQADLERWSRALSAAASR